MSAGRFGQTILLAALLADFLTMFLITAYVAVRSTGLTLEILLIVLLFVPVVLLYQLGVRGCASLLCGVFSMSCQMQPHRSKSGARLRSWSDLWCWLKCLALN